MGKLQLENGMIFNHWTFLGVIKSDGRRRKGLFKCTCGKELMRVIYDISSGHSKSCGCQAGQFSTHGFASRKNRSREYTTWASMKQRCGQQNNPAYINYGARGITVCKRWMKFENFLADMGNAPSERHQLDRINNNKGYSKSNCRWATKTENMRNTRRNNRIKLCGLNLTITEWSEISGIPARTIGWRIQKGWSKKHAIFCPQIKCGEKKNTSLMPAQLTILSNHHE